MRYQATFKTLDGLKVDEVIEGPDKKPNLVIHRAIMPIEVLADKDLRIEPRRVRVYKLESRTGYRVVYREVDTGDMR